MPKRGVIFASDERLYYCGMFLREKEYEVQIVRDPAEWDPEKVRAKDLDFVFLPIRGTSDGTITLGGIRIDLGPFLERLKRRSWQGSGRTMNASFPAALSAIRRTRNSPRGILS